MKAARVPPDRIQGGTPDQDPLSLPGSLSDEHRTGPSPTLRNASNFRHDSGSLTYHYTSFSHQTANVEGRSRCRYRVARGCMILRSSTMPVGSGSSPP